MPATVRLTSDDPAHGLDRPFIAFCFEGAPPEACRTKKGADGSVSFQTSISGRVVSITDASFTLSVGGAEVIVRHLLPSSIELSGLHGKKLLVTVEQRYAGSGRATIDAEIRDAKGTLVLWARDGRMPVDRDARGLTLRVMLEPRAERLAVGHRDGVTTIDAPGLASIGLSDGTYDTLLTRVGDDDLAWVLLRR